MVATFDLNRDPTPPPHAAKQPHKGFENLCVGEHKPGQNRWILPITFGRIIAARIESLSLIEIHITKCYYSSAATDSLVVAQCNSQADCLPIGAATGRFRTPRPTSSFSHNPRLPHHHGLLFQKGPLLKGPAKAISHHITVQDQHRLRSFEYQVSIWYSEQPRF